MQILKNLWIVWALAWLTGTAFTQCHGSAKAIGAESGDIMPSVGSSAVQSEEGERTVLVELMLRKSGAVGEARVLNGPTTLHAAAIKAVKKRNYKNWTNDWPFSRDIAVEIHFTRDMSVPPEIRRVMRGGVPSCVLGGQPMGYMPPPWSGVLPQSVNDLLHVQPTMPVLAFAAAK